MNNTVPDGWSEDVIGSYVADSVAGEWGSEADGGDDDIPVLRATNFSESGAVDYRKLAIRSVVEKKRLKKSLQRGDIVIEKSGGSPTQPVGRVIYFDNDQPFLYSNFTQKLTPVSGCDSKYLFYKLYFEYQNGTVLKFQQQTTGIINFQLAEYLLFKSVFPPLPEQQKIAAILSSVDDVIEKVQAQIDKLKDLKTGMMQELLTKGIGHTEFKDSPVGRIPVGWDVVRTGEVTKSIVPGRNKPKNLTGEIPWLTITDLDEIYVRKSKSNLGVNRDVLKEAAGKTIPQNSVIMTVVGEFGISSVASCEMVINQQLHGFVCSSDLNPTFLCLSLRFHKQQMEQLATQTTIAYMNKDNAESVLFAKPSVEEQEKIVSVIMSIEDKLMSVQSKFSSLQNTKKALMQDLLTGTVRVKVD